MKFLYYSIVNLPTDKAYGVTVDNTNSAISKIGHTVLTISPKNIDQYTNSSLIKLVAYIIEKIKLTENFLVFNKGIFRLRRLLLNFISIKVIPKDVDVLWTRDLLIAWLNYRKKYIKKIVVEIHMELNLIDRLIIKNLSSVDKIIIAPISQPLTDAIVSVQTKNTRLKVVQSPMAVPEIFLNSSFEFICPNNNDFKIGYIGSVFSAGHNQRILEVIECILTINQSLNFRKFNANFIGIEKELIPKLTNKFSKACNLEILTLESRQSHSALLPKLEKCNLFILPYPEGKYFENRFPLKALEYAALNRPILVSNTIAHRNIFSDSEVWFYEPNNCQSLRTEIIKILNNPELARKKSTLALKKAKNFSYFNRVKSILSEF